MQNMKMFNPDVAPTTATWIYLLCFKGTLSFKESVLNKWNPWVTASFYYLIIWTVFSELETRYQACKICKIPNFFFFHFEKIYFKQ